MAKTRNSVILKYCIFIIFLTCAAVISILHFTGMLSPLVLAVLALFSAGASADSELPAYRLRGDVVPTHYIVEISTDLEGFTFEGKVWIKLECKTATDTIYLHSRNLTIPEKEVTFKHVASEKEFEDITISGISYEDKNEFLIVKLGEKVTPGKNYILHIPFHGILSEGLAGYYRSSYFDRAANTTKWLAVTQFESTDARRAFPCFDEPGMKAKFTIKMAHKEGLKSISNMPLQRTSPVEGKPGWVWDEYQDTVPMSTYLVAFMVSEFEYRESDPQPNKVLFRVWARRDAIDQVEFARKVGPKFLSYYEQYFDVGYPLPKQDMVAIPDFNAGAMENWGLITYRETALLYDENVTSQAFQHSIASVIAHELAHQWFGNLVTMRWWTDLWLNEGFATYVAGLGVHNEFPEWNSLNADAVNNLLAVYSLDSLASSHPVSVPIGHPSEITQIFDHISYKKGAFLLRMMNLFLGEEVFRHGVSEYLKKHRYGNAEQDDLWASLTEQAHKTQALPKEMTVKQIMDSWTVQTGYPVLSVKREYDSGKAIFNQKRYLAVKGKPEDEKGCWWVPLTFSTPQHLDFNETRPRDWLSCDKAGLSLDVGAAKQDWLIVNNKFTGLYRVNYDDQNWQLISDALNGPDYSKIDTLNRVQILADVLDLAWRGDLSYRLAFHLLRYLKQEAEYLPWKAGLGGLSNIDRLLRRTPVYEHFRKYMQKLLSPIYEKFSRMTDTPKTFEGVKHQSLVLSWACRFNVGDCNSQASQLFLQWKKSQNPDDITSNPIPKDLRGIVYCQGVKEGGEEAWTFMWNRYRNSNVGTEQSLILGALGCTREVWLLNRYLEWSIDEKSGIRRQDSTTVFASVARTDVGYFLANKFLRRNINKIYNYFGPKATRLGRYIGVIADQMIDEEDLNELKALTETHQALLEQSRLSIRQSLESVVVNVAWMKDYYQTISQTLTV
ncbi:aminopeptidase N-like isoform X2 [Macrosteles quadrilineatus]|uniref:aminopeptidase N-like isoform X2 n=1 Tax=Macrosteles quadrilineatus TaxID=74068 RepID=UPI0023E2B93D|nr:aminopeptidase N-like isoform X2 [Macrosteles quadrilineatus]